MTDFHEIQKIVNEINKYAELMEDEYGEALLLLGKLHYRSEYLGDDLEKSLETVILNQIEFLKENCEIVTDKEEVTRTVETVDIVWK